MPNRSTEPKIFGFSVRFEKNNLTTIDYDFVDRGDPIKFKIGVSLSVKLTSKKLQTTGYETNHKFHGFFYSTYNF